MGWRTTLGLAFAVLAVGVYVWIDLAGEIGGSRPAPPETEVKRLLSFAADEVETIHIRKGQLDVRLERTPHGWSHSQKPAALDDFLRGLQDLAEIMSVDVGPEDLPEYGLDLPQGSVELTLRNRAVVTLLIGRPNPPATGIYVQIGGENRVVLTGAIVSWEIEKALSAVTSNAEGSARTPQA